MCPGPSNAYNKRLDVNKLVNPQGKPFKEPEPLFDKALFRWIMLILITVAAKVLNKEELMLIYRTVGKTVGFTTMVDGFHTEVVRMIDGKEKSNE